MGLDFENESIWVNDIDKVFFVTAKFKNNNYQNCRRIDTTNVGEVTRQVSKLIKEGYTKKFAHHFDIYK